MVSCTRRFRNRPRPAAHAMLSSSYWHRASCLKSGCPVCFCRSFLCPDPKTYLCLPRSTRSCLCVTALSLPGLTSSASQTSLLLFSRRTTAYLPLTTHRLCQPPANLSNPYLNHFEFSISSLAGLGCLAPPLLSSSLLLWLERVHPSYSTRYDSWFHARRIAFDLDWMGALHTAP